MRQLARALRVLLRQRLADIAQMRPGKRDQTQRAGAHKPGFFQFGAATVLILAISPRKQFAQRMIALPIAA